MSTQINYHALYSDYSDVLSCLSNIQQAEQNGVLADYHDLLDKLRYLENDLLKTLYIQSIHVLAVLDGVNPSGPGAHDDYFYGDFDGSGFLYDDFYVGYMDFSGTGYSAIFRNIIALLTEIKSRGSSIDIELVNMLDAALIAVLEFFWEIKRELAAKGLDLCDESSTDLYQYNNSRGVYLQAAGANGLVDIPKGIHLRWCFTDELGDFHLPKGDYFDESGTSLVGYNKPHDFVRIYRTAYSTPHIVSIDFTSVIPVVNYANKSWMYTINTNDGLNVYTSHVRLIFENKVAYDLLSKSVNPLSHYPDFINLYHDVIRVEVLDNACFNLGFVMSNPATAPLPVKLEAVCGLESEGVFDPNEDVLVHKTVQLLGQENGLVSIKAENIKYVRAKKDSQLTFTVCFFETYTDVLRNTAESDWQEIGEGFGLSQEELVVFERLENPNALIDNRWPHYNGGARVRVANYKDKWREDRENDPPVQHVLDTYLVLSETDPRAEEFLQEEGITIVEGSEPGITVSYLDVLNLTAMDYHFARMLGLGHIDTSLPNDNETYLYQLRYTNRKSLDAAETVEYTYTTLPISLSDDMLPEKPKMRPLSYRFPDEEGNMNAMLDENGYSKTEAVRVINIGREKEYEELENRDFFNNLHEVRNSNSFLAPRAVYYGVEYRSSTQEHYVKPEITYHDNLGGHIYYSYDDEHVDGVLETVPVLDNEESLYVHFEQDNGVHCYAIYGINWFGRVSVLSDERATDETTFLSINRLLPPVNVAVQYIQPEEPLIFTTSTEQEWLQGRQSVFPGQDINLTRITFDWIDIVDITDLKDDSIEALNNVPRANQVQSLFLDRLPLEIAGKIVSTIRVPEDNRLIKLRTGSYVQIDGEVVTPSLHPQDHTRFIDSILTTTDGDYRIVAIAQGVEGPDITIQKRTAEEIITQEEDSDSMGIRQEWIAPAAGIRFTAVENLGEPSNWIRMISTVSLVSFADANQPIIEAIADAEGNESRFWIGGVSDDAEIIPLFGADIPQEEELLGFYRISLPAYSLAPHPQINIPYVPESPDNNSPEQPRLAHVEWYKGIIRVPLAGNSDESKEVPVLVIESLNPLVLYVYDADYLLRPIHVSVDSQELVRVNFHPGYKVYCYTEPDPGIFNRDHIEPTGLDNDRKTLIALQSKDVALSGYASVPTMPSVLLARRIEVPQPVEMTDITLFKVRPDATGRASFSFDIKVANSAGGQLRNPFGFVFYRTDHQEVLEALYDTETIAQIHEDLSGLTADPFYYQRFSDLVNLTFDTENPGNFKVYEAIPQPYGLPVPDKDGLTLPSDFVEQKEEKYKIAIQATMMPLTEQPPIFSYIKEGVYTENSVPVFRDLDGNLLDPTDPLFNPFPMVRRFQKDTAWNIRFTDYFLNGNSRDLYFYAAVEINNQLQPGMLSAFAGPIIVLQTMPSEALQVKSYAIDMDPYFGNPQIHFHIAPPSAEDLVSKVRLYRFDRAEDTASLLNSESHIDIALGDYDANGYYVSDRFADKEAFPFGETVFYQLVGLRTIANEGDEDEDVLTLASDTIEIAIADTRRPLSPELVYDPEPPTLRWEPVGKDCTYYIYRQNNKGNWEHVHHIVPPEANDEMHYLILDPLPEFDEDGDRLYYRYKVSVESSIGQFSLQENEITI